MKFKLAVLSAVILAGIAATAAIADFADIIPTHGKAAGMSHCDSGQMSHDPAGGMSCHSGGPMAKDNVPAPSKGCCK